MYPDAISLYVDRKRRGNGVIEAQFKLAEGWTDYRVVGRDMPAAMRLSVEMFVRMRHGGDTTPLHQIHAAFRHVRSSVLARPRGYPGGTRQG